MHYFCLILIIFVINIAQVLSSNNHDDDLVYHPSNLVRQSHKILHLNENLQPVSNQFQPFKLFDWNNYTKSLLPIPIICASLGIFAIFLLQLFLILRIFIKQLRFLPSIKVTGRKSLTLIKYAIDPRIFRIYKISIIILVILVDEILVFGSSYLSQGVSIAHDAINNLNYNITLLLDQGYSLNSTGNILHTDLYNASFTCNSAGSLASNMSTVFYPFVNDYIDYLGPLPTKCNDAHNNLHKWGVDYKHSSIWSVYAFYMVLIALYIFGMWYKNQTMLRVSVGIGEISMILMFILIGVEMVIVVSLKLFFFIILYLILSFLLF